MTAKNVVKVEFGVADATAIHPVAWTAMGELTQASSFLRFVNTSASAIEISYDGVFLGDVCLPNHDFNLNFMANATPPSGISKLAKGTTIYARGTAAIAGNIYFFSYYVAQE